MSNSRSSHDSANKKKPLGDGISTAATPEGAARLAALAANSENKVGFSGSMFRRKPGGIFAGLLNVLFGKDPDIFDSAGRVRHKFPDSKWKAWDARIREGKEYDWKKHSGRK